MFIRFKKTGESGSDSNDLNSLSTGTDTASYSQTFKEYMRQPQ